MSSEQAQADAGSSGRAAASGAGVEILQALQAEVDRLTSLLCDAIPALGCHARDFSQRGLIEACKLAGSSPEDWTQHPDVLARLQRSGTTSTAPRPSLQDPDPDWREKFVTMEVEWELSQERVGRLEEALREVLDVVTGWTGPLTALERITAIARIARAALAGVETRPRETQAETDSGKSGL